jgi:hypothetical protein
LPIRTIDLLSVRRGLFAFSATIGNLRAIGINIPFLNRLRQSAVKLERGVGDWSAVVDGTIDQRIANRILGRQAGRLIGEATRGIPGNFGKRVGRRVLSSKVTSPGLAYARRYLKGQL